MSADIHPEWIAAHWGSAGLRAWAMGQDTVLAEAMSRHATENPTPQEVEAALLALIGPWLGQGEGRVPVIAAGLPDEGCARNSLRPVPAAPVAAPLICVTPGDSRIDLRCVPGLSQRRPSADLMQGGETALAGVIARDREWDSVVCLPGPRGLWAELSAGEVVSFRSFLSMELMGLLARHSSLRGSVVDHGIADGGGTWGVSTADARASGEVPAGASSEIFDAAFDATLTDVIARPEILAARLAQIRAESILDGLPPAAARGSLAALLIGAELAAARPWWLGRDVVLLDPGDPGGIARLYARGLGTLGLVAETVPESAAVLAGLAVAWGLAGDGQGAAGP